MIIFDVEIRRTIEQCSRCWSSTDEMGVGVCALWNSLENRYRVFGEGDIDTLRKLLLDAPAVGGFNILDFDLPVIFGIPRHVWSTHKTRALFVKKSNDILRRIWLALGFDPDVQGPKAKGWKLENIITHTLKEAPKLMNGAAAPVKWQEGKFMLVTNYCLDDVQLERHLIEFTDRYGYVNNGETWLDLAPKNI
jgi:hypothetical protein